MDRDIRKIRLGLLGGLHLRMPVRVQERERERERDQVRVRRPKGDGNVDVVAGREVPEGAEVPLARGTARVLVLVDCPQRTLQKMKARVIAAVGLVDSVDSVDSPGRLELR